MREGARECALRGCAPRGVLLSSAEMMMLRKMGVHWVADIQILHSQGCWSNCHHWSKLTECVFVAVRRETALHRLTSFQ